MYKKTGWYHGWRVEYAMDVNEIIALKSILDTTDKQSPSNELIKKLYAGCTAISAHSDCFHLQRENAYKNVATLEHHIKQQAHELEMLRKQREAMTLVFKQIRETLVCPICKEVALLPMILSSCGHMACQNCLKQLDDAAFMKFTTATGGSSLQHLKERRCPLCRIEIIGGGFPVLPLKEVTSILILNGCVEVAEMPAIQKHLKFKAITYEKLSVETKHLHALQIGCYAQTQLAQHSVSGVIATVTQEQWMSGVYILFESAVARVFFESFATTLHRKAGGVNVLVNSSERMLAVQLLEKKKDKKPNKSEGHLLIKVATDGRFVVSTTMKSVTADTAIAVSNVNNANINVGNNVSIAIIAVNNDNNTNSIAGNTDSIACNTNNVAQPVLVSAKPSHSAAV